ncbi:hypothetical protein VTN77DRAFT_9207 [Rasamsonia byssochlamydoides]|uniref:uncharacterized protein n=1 Tax=Rasamsonia byssochlamydoides TaxID=89139 RepID=UPI003744645A
MAFRGERFVLDLSDDEDAGVNRPPSIPDLSRAGPSLGLIGDIMERTPTTATPPAPKPASSASTGFPAHKNRVRQSAFKQRRTGTGQPQPRPGPDTRQESPSIEEEKKSIDEENRKRLAAMSPEQIQKERAELMENLSPSLIERFLRRANIDDEPPTQPSRKSADSQDPSPKPEQLEPQTQKDPAKQSKSVSFDIPETQEQASESTPEESSRTPPDTSAHISTAPSTSTASAIDDQPPPYPPPDLRPASEIPSGPIHFPTPPPRQDPMPNLDPSSPSFLEDLQTHYFPDTPHDPALLSWLKPPSRDPDDPDASSAYHPASSATAVPPSSLRFTLTGTILSPSTSLSLPTTLGLHHHAKDPEAAGYTIPELSILSRSTVPAQRCIAWQVIGRILYRLGKGEFGEPGSTLVEGLWSVVEREGVVARMLEEAEGGDSERNKTDRGAKARIGKHASAKAWAVEGVWLWQAGGGGDRGILKEGDVRSR